MCAFRWHLALYCISKIPGYMATSKGAGTARRGERPRALSVWFKQPFQTTNPSRLLIESSALIIDFLEVIVEKGQLRNTTTKQPSSFNVTHKELLISHDVALADINGITTKNPLIVEQIDDCKC